MTLFRRILDNLRPRIVVVRGPEMTVREINAALAGCLDTHPVWRAVHQLIDLAERTAWRDAEHSAAQPGKVAAYVGAAEQLSILRSDLEKHRALGRKQEAST